MTENKASEAVMLSDRSKLNRFGIDPALATGPFITTTNDIVGLIIYFGVGHLLLHWLQGLPINLFH